jgi:hypothetical protein
MLWVSTVSNVTLVENKKILRDFTFGQPIGNSMDEVLPSRVPELGPRVPVFR